MTDIKTAAEQAIHELRNALVPALFRAQRDGRNADIEALQRGCDVADRLAAALKSECRWLVKRLRERAAEVLEDCADVTAYGRASELTRFADALEAEMPAPEVARLDRSKPPPGYKLHCEEAQPDALWTVTVGEADDISGQWLDEDKAVAAAWTHYHKHNDPPGMWTGFNATRMRPVVADFLPRMGVRLVELRCAGGPFQTSEEARSIARDAAWAWYWRRKDLADTVDHIAWTDCMTLDMSIWPDCLAWPDDQVAAVERWTVDPDAEMPAFLRTG